MLSDRLLALIRNPETPTYVLRDAAAEEEEPVPNVYVVSGDTGAYSDRRSWTVAAYLEESQAKAFCDRLNQWCRLNDCADGRPSGWNDLEWEEQDKFGPPDDPNFQLDYTGVEYVVWTIPLKVEEGSESPP